MYAISQGKVEELRKGGSKNGQLLYELRQNVDIPIAAILTLNTIANSMGAPLAGSLVGQYFVNNPGPATIVYSIFFTLLILVFAEIVPKTLGVTYADKIAPPLAPVIKVIIFITTPFVWLSQKLTSVIRKNKESSDEAPSETEILAMVELAKNAGKLGQDEVQWATNALLLNDVSAKELMTPRTVVYMLPTDLPLSEIHQKSDHWSHSRLPLVENNDPDKVEGIVYRRDVFDQLVSLEKEELANKTLRELLRPAVFVPETIPCNELITRFISTKEHLLIVTNEFGGMEGVISLEDVMEFILGEEIVDPYDKFPDMQEYARIVAQKRMRLAKLAETRQQSAREQGKNYPGKK